MRTAVGHLPLHQQRLLATSGWRLLALADPGLVPAEDGVLRHRYYCVAATVAAVAEAAAVAYCSGMFLHDARCASPIFTAGDILLRKKNERTNAQISLGCKARELCLGSSVSGRQAPLRASA